jgi:anti-sigma factor RsiW
VTHLGDRVASLIDGQLPVDVSGKAMTHLASCPACQEAADLERLTKQRLASLGSPEPGADLIRRLLDVGGDPGPVAQRPPAAQPTLRVDASTRPLGRRPVPAQSRPTGPAPRTTKRLSRSARSRWVVAVAGAACLVGVGVAGGVAAGQGSRPPIAPPVDSLVVRGGTVTVNLPLQQQTARLSSAIDRP